MGQTVHTKDNANLTCCDEQRIVVDEAFSYECQFIDGKLFIDTNDYCSDGFTNARCVNCDKHFNDAIEESEW